VGDEVLYILWWCAYWSYIAHLVIIISLLPVNLATTDASSLGGGVEGFGRTH